MKSVHCGTICPFFHFDKLETICFSFISTNNHLSFFNSTKQSDEKFTTEDNAEQKALVFNRTSHFFSAIFGRLFCFTLRVCSTEPVSRPLAREISPPTPSALHLFFRPTRASWHFGRLASSRHRRKLHTAPDRNDSGACTGAVSLLLRPQESLPSKGGPRPRSA